MPAPPTAMTTEALSRNLSPDGRIRDIPRLLQTIYSGIPPARLCGIQHPPLSMVQVLVDNRTG